MVLYICSHFVCSGDLQKAVTRHLGCVPPNPSPPSKGLARRFPPLTISTRCM